MVAPVAKHPVNKNGVIVYDLSQHPGPLLQLSVEEISRRLFTPSSELPEGVDRIPLKTVHLNKCPVVVPMGTLTDQAAERWAIDVAVAERHLQQLKSARDLPTKVQQVHSNVKFEPESNPDLNLYGGGFFSENDRRSMDSIRTASPLVLSSLGVSWEDTRISEMLLRYRARNWPATLSKDERRHWNEFRAEKIKKPEGGGSITLAQYRKRLAHMIVDPSLDERAREILSQLVDWPAVIGMD